ncbi:MAG: beta-galactosidase, partial [Solirubrobacteraceae bacterium]|nr:beta-galactosidase [Solirubrobacteraceae bacterium]
RQQRQGFDRAWFNWGGLAWPVTAAPAHDAELRLVGVQTALVRGAALVTLTVELRDTRATGAPAPVAVAGSLSRAAGTLPVTFDPVVLAPGERRRVSARLAVARPALWAPGSPALYDLALTAGPGGAEVRQAIGLRELRREGRRLLLNGRPLRIAGAGLPPDAEGHGDALTPADQDRIVAELRAIGANAARSQHPLSDELLSRLDAAGILVWQQVGPFDKAGRFWAQTPRRRALAIGRAVAAADRTAAHPSVLAFNLANEVAGRGHPGGQARYIDTLARALKRRAPGVLVVADVWGRHPPRRAGGRLFRDLDAVGLTEYIGIFDAAGRPAREQEALVRTMLRRARVALPGKPLVITEFGANANGRNPADRPGGLRYQARLLTRRIGFYARRAEVAGTLIWVLRDYAVTPGFRGGTLRGRVPGLALSAPLNEKGLFRYDGSPKPAVAAVARAYARTAAPSPEPAHP